MKYITSILLICITAAAIAQDIRKAVKKLDSLLEHKSVSVSNVLSDETYMHLHSKTEFRELIKKYAPVGKTTIVTPAEPGKRIKVKCEVKDKDGKSFANALVYVYQTSAKGWYSDTAAHILVNEGDMRHARLFGYVITDSEGNFELETIQPSGYPQSDLPAHIHLAMWKGGKYVPGAPGELLFDDDTRLTADRRARATAEGFLISKNSGAPSSPVYQYTIKLKQ